MNKLEEYLKAVEILRGIYVDQKLRAITVIHTGADNPAKFTTGMALDFGVKMGWLVVEQPPEHNYISEWVLTDKGREFFGL